MTKPSHLSVKNGKNIFRWNLLCVYFLVPDITQNRFFAGKIKKYTIFQWPWKNLEKITNISLKSLKRSRWFLKSVSLEIIFTCFFSHLNWKNFITKIAKNFFWMQHIKNIWIHKKTMTSKKFQPKPRRPIRLSKTYRVKSKWLMTRICLSKNHCLVYHLLNNKCTCTKQIAIHFFRNQMFKWSR